MPDPLGQPRPPAAPHTASRYPGPRKPRITHHDPRAGSGGYPDGYAPGPAGEPPLESVRPPPAQRSLTAAVNAATLTLIGAAILVVVNWHEISQDGPPPWLLWLIGSFFVLMFLWQYLDQKDTPPPLPIVAGARWVSCGTGSRVVRLYDLVKIEVTHLGHPADELEPALNLFDSIGTALALDPSLLEANPELWALVHHGIRHSVAHGAEIDHKTRERLRLPTSPRQV